MIRIVLFFLILGALTACQRELSDFQNSEYISLQDFYVKNATTPKKMSANSSQWITFTTSKGTKISFPDNAFVNSSGSSVTGDVDIEVLEILSPMEMILNNKPSMSNGAPLQSGGEFFIRVTKNGQKLRLATNSFVELKLPSNSTMNGMKVFNGRPQEDGSVNWIENNNQGNFVFPDSLGKTSMFADSVDWINCDKFYNDPVITYSVLPGNCPLIDSTKIYLHLTGRNTVMSFPKNGISDKLIASPATIVAICVKEGKLYTSVMPVILENGKSVTLQFEPSSEEALKRKLQTLR